MKSKSKLTELIYDAIDQANEQLSDEFRIEKSTETVLFGQGGKLDSLGLVSLLIAIEQNIEDEFEQSITIADEKAMSQKHSPFRSIFTLVEYLDTLIDEV